MVWVGVKRSSRGACHKSSSLLGSSERSMKYAGESQRVLRADTPLPLSLTLAIKSSAGEGGSLNIFNKLVGNPCPSPTPLAKTNVAKGNRLSRTCAHSTWPLPQQGAGAQEQGQGLGQGLARRVACLVNTPPKRLVSYPQLRVAIPRYQMRFSTPYPFFRVEGGASCNVDKFLSLAKVFCMGVARKGDHLAWLLFKFLPYAKQAVFRR